MFLRRVALLLLVGASGTVGADGAAAPDAAHYTRVRNAALGAGQPDTLCENILVKRRTVGVHCRSASASLLQALGVSVSSTDASGAAAERGVTFATGMGQYTGTPRTLHGRDGFTAEVDCDPGNGPVYRATATCWPRCRSTAPPAFTTQSSRCATTPPAPRC